MIHKKIGRLIYNLEDNLEDCSQVIQQSYLEPHSKTRWELMFKLENVTLTFLQVSYVEKSCRSLEISLHENLIQ